MIKYRQDWSVVVATFIGIGIAIVFRSPCSSKDFCVVLVMCMCVRKRFATKLARGLPKPAASIAGVVDDLAALIDENRVLPGLQDEAFVALEALQSAQRKASTARIRACVYAPIKTGKSTLLNALLGAEYLHSDDKPATSCLTTIRHNVPLRVVLCELC